MPSENEWLSEMRRMANTNGVSLRKEPQLLEVMRSDVQSGAHFVNVFKGTLKTVLLVTSQTTFSIQFGTFSIKSRWSLPHASLRAVRTGRSTFRGYVSDSVVLESDGDERKEFTVGFHSPDQYYEIEIAERNAQVIVEQIQDVAELGPGAAQELAGGFPLRFDPEGPEKASTAGKQAYGEQDWPRALELYVTALDRLHDFYVFEQFRNRQPSPKDAWIVEGYIAALGVTRDQRPEFDVGQLVRTATHRLRTIISASKGAGVNPVLFERALSETGRLVPDVDVSDIFWE